MRWRTASLAVAALALALAAVQPVAAQIAPDNDAPDAASLPRTARELADRYFNWRGALALEQLQTIHERLYLETPSGRHPGEFWLDRDGHLRRESVSDGVRRVEVAGPDGAWIHDGDSPVQDAPGAAERARRWALLMFGDALKGRDGASAELAGTAEEEDHTWSVLRVSFGDADTYDALIDPRSGGLCCFRITEAGVARTELFGDWRLVDGVRMPFRQLTHAGLDIASTVSTVELNAPLAAALFQRPAPAASGG